MSLGLQSAVTGAPDLIVVDEIGPIEMASGSFRNTVSRLWTSNSPTLATVGLGSRYSELELVRLQALRLEMTTSNREETHRRLMQQLNEWMDSKEPT